MKIIDEAAIREIISGSQDVSAERVRSILKRSGSLQRLSLSDSSALLSVRDKGLLDEMYRSAAQVKDAIYGKRVVLFAPLYISNLCMNDCQYCAFRSGNKELQRKALSVEEIKEQTTALLKSGHKRVLLVAGEAPPPGKTNIDYYVEAIEAIYSVSVGPHKVKRVNINCAPLSVEEFERLKKAGIGTFQIFQETYHEATYRECHRSGPKSDPDNRLDAVDRAFTAGIDDVGIGVLYGLYDHVFDTIAMLSHVEYLEKKFNVGPHTISVPRLEPASGSKIASYPPYRVSDEDFKKIVAVLRLSVPYTGLILSTRETPQLRDELFDLGISQVSAASSTSPGGYDEKGSSKEDGQFSVGDHRTLDEVMDSIINHGFIPSFCAACYRKERTGEKFMDLAKPGTIQGKCRMNALITLKEYLDDFASEKVRKQGYELIRREKDSLDADNRAALSRFFADIDKGLRDEYV